MSKWHEFYKSRDPERYLAYAKRRYEPFLAILHAHIRSGDRVLEAGCGMGTITRALIERGARGYQFIMVDKCPEMVGMAAWNTRLCHEDKIRLYTRDIMTLDEHFDNQADVIHSHGVLEHFPDDDIRQIIRRQKRCGARALIHYVPGEKYDTPSFGDERLMPAEQWEDICKPHAIVPFNDGFDYALVWCLATA